MEKSRIDEVSDDELSTAMDIIENMGSYATAREQIKAALEAVLKGRADRSASITATGGDGGGQDVSTTKIADGGGGRKLEPLIRSDIGSFYGDMLIPGRSDEGDRRILHGDIELFHPATGFSFPRLYDYAVHNRLQRCQSMGEAIDVEQWADVHRDQIERLRMVDPDAVQAFVDSGTKFEQGGNDGRG